jgi:hypothetical protein
MNALLKIVVGAGVAVAIWTLLDDFLLYLQIFFMVVIIPMMWLTAVGVFSVGTYEVFQGATVGAIQRMRDKIDEYHNQLQQEAEVK